MTVKELHAALATLIEAGHGDLKAARTDPNGVPQEITSATYSEGTGDPSGPPSCVRLDDERWSSAEWHA